MARSLELRNFLRHRNARCADRVKNALDLLRGVVARLRFSRRCSIDCIVQVTCPRRVRGAAESSRWPNCEPHARRRLCRRSAGRHLCIRCAGRQGQHSRRNFAGCCHSERWRSLKSACGRKVTLDTTPSSECRVSGWGIAVRINKTKLLDDLHSGAPYDPTSAKLSLQIIVVSPHPIVKKMVVATGFVEHGFDCLWPSHWCCAGDANLSRRLNGESGDTEMKLIRASGGEEWGVAEARNLIQTKAPLVQRCGQ